MKTLIAFVLAFASLSAHAQSRSTDFAHMPHTNGTTVLEFNDCVYAGKTYEHLLTARYVFHSGRTYSGCYWIDQTSYEVTVLWQELNQKYTYPIANFTINVPK